MRTLGRVTHGLAWTAAAGLLALLISTNCADPIGVVRPFHCMFDFECSGAERCDTDTGQCGPIVCTGNPRACPSALTCYPPTGPAQCTAPAQVACDGGSVLGDTPACSSGKCPGEQVCRSIDVGQDFDGDGRPDLFRPVCGCVPVAK